MEYNFTFKLFGTVLTSLIKKGVPDKSVRKEIQKEYKEILTRASDIGSNNNLIFSYTLAAFFIAMNRKDGLSPQKNCDILSNAIENSNLIKPMLGDSKSYFAEKKMDFRRKWAKETHEKKYKNDWVVDFIEKTDAFEFGLDYTECGVCKLCRDENCFELAKYLCKLDFMLVEVIGIHLDRTTTLAEGGDKCDFRFSKNKN